MILINHIIESMIVLSMMILFINQEIQQPKSLHILENHLQIKRKNLILIILTMSNNNNNNNNNKINQ